MYDGYYHPLSPNIFDKSTPVTVIREDIAQKEMQANRDKYRQTDIHGRQCMIVNNTNPFIFEILPI